MLVGFLSDLHIDHIFNGLSKKKTENVLVEFIKRKELDYIVFSGDISGNWSLSLDILDCINQRTNTKAFMVSGNHDIWDLNKNTGSILQELSKHPYYLNDEFVTLNDEWELFGGLGWYDYSYKPLGVVDYYVEKKKKQLWNDSNFIDLQTKDTTFTMNQIDKWEKSFTNNKNKKNVIFSQHFVPHKEFIVIKENNPKWNFTNSYIGSSEIGRFIESEASIKISAFGHTHKRFGEVQLRGKTYICNPLGYPSEWVSDVFEDELEECLITQKI